ncbi:autoinducer binding domain-containing protein [Frigidibacter sp. ROC022]|uniref:autoinducer binding domain-containing protein n=1 Tax=Frigidibacter sp. ROC022 TaxID=2971796 RepID=UPI00215B60D8|nr:autoinducer binding domain-containing protein [Frigidibacter sp. ROC022]MCR8724599.1 autoinducer binding domain-containing protein [Frigidibacter sp. ROC022]MCR8724691.1 autoinducer binding domain-containing protein [Frigidibacter sp. ROC022]
MFDDVSSFPVQTPEDGAQYRLPWTRAGGTTFDFGELAISGYHIAACASFGLPAVSRSTLPEAWVSEYTEDALMLRDPVMLWIYAHSGVTRLSQIKEDDDSGIMARAARHGLKYGAVVSHGTESSGKLLSYGIFYRDDREFTDDELELLRLRVQSLHNTSVTFAARKKTFK